MKRLINKTKNNLRQVRHARVRAGIVGTAEKPRLSVFRSLRGVALQLVDDGAGRTLAAVDVNEVKPEKTEGKTGKTSQAYAAGKVLAQKAIQKGIKKIVFDRGGYAYHGRVAAVADGARAGGLEF